MDSESYVNRVGVFEPVAGFVVRVGVIGAKRAYGHVRLCIAPLDGTGCLWVNEERVSLDAEDNHGISRRHARNR